MFRIPVKVAGQSWRRCTRMFRRRSLRFRSSPGSTRAGPNLLRIKCLRRCAVNLAGTLLNGLRPSNTMATQPIEQENPLREGIRLEAAAEPCTVVIFGASGDLTRRKLMPALYNLMHEQRLPSSFAVIGVARREKTDQSFRDEMQQAVAEFSRTKIDQSVWDSFARKIYYLRGDFNDAGTHSQLNLALARCEQRH